MPSPVNLLKLLRHRLRRKAAFRRHGEFVAVSPILFANAFPKSGTHLLVQILKACARIGPAVDSGLPAVAMFEGVSGAPRPTLAILHDLDRLLPGDVAYGHLHARPEIEAFFIDRHAAVCFLYRDLRDVAVSHAHYVTEIETAHAHHKYYRSLPDFDARLRTSILGRPELGDLFPDIRARFASYLGWFTAPRVLTLRFEDLIENPKPVPSGVKDRKSTIGDILDHLATFNFQPSTGRGETIDFLAHAIDPKTSPTFRTGTAGGWRKRFTAEHKALFKQVAGELLVELGYEQDLAW